LCSHEAFNKFITAVDRLRSSKGENINSKERENSYNPIAEIITPEWYYSHSDRLFEDTVIDWNILDGFDFVHQMANALETIDRDIRAGGEFEKSFCSWYQSYHYLPRTKWGIHIRYTSWMAIAARLNDDCPSLISRPLDSVKAAFLYLFNHSLFHYYTDNAATIMEILSQNEDVYARYLSKVYTKVFNSSYCVEEALANAYLYEMAEICHIDKVYLKTVLLNQSHGFRDFIEYMGPNFERGKRRLLSQVQTATFNPSYDSPIEDIMTISNAKSYSHGCIIPIWIHKRARSLNG
jgi:hypothetical protein